MRQAALLALLCLASCGYRAAQDMRNPQYPNGLIGRTILDARLCAGEPDKTTVLADDLAQAEWDYKDSAPALSLSLVLLGTLSVGGGAQCSLVVFYHKDGKIDHLAFPHCTGTLIRGPEAAASTLVEECRSHPSRVQIPSPFSAFQNPESSLSNPTKSSGAVAKPSP